MPDQNTLLAVSAFSGLAGAILTQALNGLFTYINDQRKYRNGVKNQYRDKKIDIAEHFYFISGETMSILKKTINFYKNRNESRSKISLKFLNREMKKLDTHLEKLNSENWKHNLIGLYFKTSLSYQEIIDANSRSHFIFLEYLDLAERLQTATGTEKEELYGQFNLTIFDLCMQYETIYEMLETAMNRVKVELLDNYAVV